MCCHRIIQYKIDTIESLETRTRMKAVTERIDDIEKRGQHKKEKSYYRNNPVEQKLKEYTVASSH